MSAGSYAFAPERYEEELAAVIAALDGLERWEQRQVENILRRYPKDGRGFFSKSEIIQGFRHLNAKLGWGRDERLFLDKMRMKPIRTLSGVAPVTVLTKPYPCPGKCIFCPSDVRMPKSYLSDEPGAQRAAQHRFDPYAQTYSRLRTYHNIGHAADKVELIILGGTWSYYPEPFQIWFVKRCFDAMNDFARVEAGEPVPEPGAATPEFAANDTTIDGRAIGRTYNAIVRDYAERQDLDGDGETAIWAELEAVQRANESGAARCVGLVVETRPDHLDAAEVLRMRRLGATKVQIGFQSLSDEVLAKNHRGHDVAATRRAVKLLRGAGYKIHAHWMPNLYGSSPAADIEDFERMFSDADFRPDELKVYPCSLIESAELMQYYERDAWRPYTHDELLFVLGECLRRAPRYCRLTRVIRDIPGTDIVDGNRMTNFREVVEADLARRGERSVDIRAREVRDENTPVDGLELRATEFDTSVGREIFLEYVTGVDRLAAFLRLSLPAAPVEIDEIARAAMIREVHVYGRLASLGERHDDKAQHSGLGRALIDEAAERARQAGFGELAVISSVGTRRYYRSLGFTDGALYQHRRL